MRTKGLFLTLFLALIIILIASGLFAGGPTEAEVNQETTGSKFGPLFPTNRPGTLLSGEIGGQMRQGGYLDLGQKVALNYPIADQVAVTLGTALFQNSHPASSVEKDRGMWSGFAGMRLTFEDPAIEVGATWNIRYQFKTGDMFRHLSLRVNLGNGGPESWSLENVFEIAPTINGNNKGVFKETLRLRRISEPLLFGFWGKEGPSCYFGTIFQYETNQTSTSVDKYGNEITTEVEFGLLFGLLSSSDPFDIGVHFGLFTPDKGGASFTGGLTLGLSLNN